MIARKPLLRTLLGAAIALGAGARIAEAQGEFKFPMPERLIVAGSTSGEIEPLLETLREKGLIDEAEAWAGGQTHYVQLGDVMLLGDDVLPSLRLLHRLSKEAEVAGGRVTMVLGPSQVMAIRGDIANVPPSNYADLATEGSEAKLEARLDRMLEELWDYNANFDEEMRKSLRASYAEYYRRTHQPGAAEFLEQIGPDTELGAWLRSSPAVIAVGELILSNGGVSLEYSAMSIEEINAKVRSEEIRDFVWVPKMVDLKSPVWWKELSTEPDGTFTEDIDEALSNLGARGMVVAHSPKLGEPMKRGRVYHVQSGFRRSGDNEGLIATLEATAARWTFSVGSRAFEAPPPAPIKVRAVKDESNNG